MTKKGKKSAAANMLNTKVLEDMVQKNTRLGSVKLSLEENAIN